jgi:hypothetical protein
VRDDGERHEMLTTDERRDLARAYAEGAHIQAESMRAPMLPTLSLAERLHALEQYVPYGANYDRAVADEYHTASRLLMACRADEAEYFVGLAECAAARHGGVS